MPMRVIGGFYKHRHLIYPENDAKIRPTKDRIRESYFNALGNIENKVFLDLCAGCGSVGIEAISRGAKKTIFVDNNKASLNYIKKNISSLGITNYEILELDALEALKLLAEKGEKIDAIYFDPPYESEIYLPILSYIYNSELLNLNCIVSFEANKKINIDSNWYKQIKEYHYGDIMVTMLKN